MVRPVPLALLAVVLAVVLLGPARASAATVSGMVYADLDGDGRFSMGDRPLGGVVVAFDGAAFATSTADGRYELDVSGAGIVWASAPDGFTPGPVFAPVKPTSRSLDLGLHPVRARTGPLRFVDASDAHLGNTSADDVRAALRQASADSDLDFVIVTGDLSSNTAPTEYGDLDQALVGLPVPFVPVPGNHDWHDGGPLYRKRYGPPMYSFSAQGVHFIVLNFNATPLAQRTFVADDLALHPAEGTVVVLTHAPPDDELAAQLAELGVDVLFTGHMHSNRVLRTGGIVQYMSEPLAMGGFDYTPAGYRVVTRQGDGFTVEHHNTVDGVVAKMTWPRPGDCLPSGPTTILAAIELGGAPTNAEVSIDGAAALPLAYGGGWSYGREVSVPTGWHTLELRARGVARERVRFCVVERAAEGGTSGEWRAPGGNAAHTVRSSTRLVPPLRTVWARATGGQVLGGAPIVTGERVIVPVVDFAEGGEGGLRAYDLRTGAARWTVRGASVPGTPVSDGQRVFALAGDGVLSAYDVASGQLAWTDDLGAGLDDWKRITTTTPALGGGVVVAIVQQRIVAFEATSGARRWTQHLGTEENSHSRVAPLIAGGLVVVTTGRAREGLVAYDLQSGEERWRTAKSVSMSLAAAPVAAGGYVYVVNVQSTITKIALATGEVEWSHRLYGNGDYIDWGYGPLATPTLADGRLIVPTPRKQLWTVDTATGAPLWRHDAAPAPLRMLPLMTRTVGFLAQAVVARDVLWLPGADGTLAALDAEDGRTLWRTNLGAPLVSGLAAAGDFLVVASYDGTVRVMTTGVGDPMFRDGAGVRAARFAVFAALAVFALAAAFRAIRS